MDPGRLLDRQIARIRALENLDRVASGSAVKVDETRAIAHEAARRHEFALAENHRQSVLEGKLRDPAPLPSVERIAQANASVRTFLCHGDKGSFDVLDCGCIHGEDLDPDLLRVSLDDFQ